MALRRFGDAGGWLKRNCIDHTCYLEPLGVWIGPLLHRVLLA
jgi:hypothetical protein